MDDPEIPPVKESVFNPTPDAGVIPEAERQMAMLTHLSALSGLVTGVGIILGPLLVWQLKKTEMPSLEVVAKEAINFNITYAIAILISSLSMFVCIGFITTPLLALAWIIYTVIAGMKANEGIYYRYPLTIRLVK